MRINSLEIEVFELTPAVAVTRGPRNYQDEEEGLEEEESEEEESEEEESEEEEPEEGDEEDEPKEVPWRSSTTFDYDGTVRTRVKGRPSAAVRQLRDASDSVSERKRIRPRLG
jgi:cobalamin biosynthesis protein CobT